MKKGVERQILISNPDSELRDLVDQALEVFEPKSLDKIAGAFQRFNTPVTIEDDDGRTGIDSNWSLKEVLKEIPEFVKSATKAGLRQDQCEEILLHILNSTPYDFERNEVNIYLLKRVMEMETKLGDDINSRDFIELKKMIGLAGKYGVIPHSLYSYIKLRRIGISTHDATKMVMKLPDADGHLAGYSFASFYDAVSSFSVAKVDPEISIEILNRFGGDRPYYNQGTYSNLTEMITFVCPSERISPQDLLSGILSNTRGVKNLDEALSRSLESRKVNTPKTSKETIFNPEEDKNKYFALKDGGLELAALPYQVKRSLSEGIKDLTKIARARSHRWEDVGEGMWIFDPKENIWYSLGGKLDVQAGKVSHLFLPYDASILSKTPYMFHIHPVDLEPLIRDPYDDFPSREFRDHVTKFLSSTPSRADYSVVAETVKNAISEIRPRSFIVHSLGLTEFIYPNDTEAVEAMAVVSRGIRDRVLLDFDWSFTSDHSPQMVNKSELVKKLIVAQNRLLPRGFSIKFSPIHH